MKGVVTVRVISGILKGRNIIGFDLDGTRPTMDRVKESLFSTIQGKIMDSICLDLFAGSGNLGIEAISEGAKEVYFVDNNIKAIKVINNNIENFNIKDKSKVLNMNYVKALEYLKEKKFDIIFLDPPYKTNYIENSIKLIDEYNLLNDDGIIICESSSIDKIIYTDKFKAIKDKRYGDKFIVILEKLC